MEKFKNILIIVLCLTLLGVYLFGGRGTSNAYKEEITKLQKINKSLLNKNDSILLLNKTLDNRIKVLDSVIKIKEDSLKITNKKIKGLQDEKDKVTDYVRNLDVNGVDRALTEYLEGR